MLDERDKPLVRRLFVLALTAAVARDDPYHSVRIQPGSELGRVARPKGAVTRAALTIEPAAITSGSRWRRWRAPNTPPAA